MSILTRAVRRIRHAVFNSAHATTDIAVRLEGHVATFRVSSPAEWFRTADFGDERPFVASFCRHISPGDVVLDVGASVGLITVFAALSGASVTAVEPDPETFARLNENLALNGLSERVNAVQMALGNRSGEVHLFTDGSAGAAPTLRSQPGRSAGPTGSATVPMASLDGEIAGGRIIPPTILKIDVEGAEVMVLEGAKRLLGGEFERRPRRIFIELHPAFLPSFHASVDGARHLLSRVGYKLAGRRKRQDQIHETWVAP